VTQAEGGLSLARASAGIFLTSLGVLTIEIALTRIFSYAINYHFAYLTIATGLLGFACAGAVLAAFPTLWLPLPRRLVLASSGAGLAAVFTLAFSSVIRFDPGLVSRDPRAMAILTTYYLVVAAPFFLAGVAVATVLAFRPERVGRLYACDLLGAGLGCALSVPLIWMLETPAVVVCGALALATAALPFGGRSPRLRALSVAGVALAFACGALTLRFGPFPPSPGTFLSTFLRTTGVEHMYAQWTPISRVDAVGWRKSEDSWRSTYNIAGVGASFTARGPEFRMIGYDGRSFAVMYADRGDPAALEMFRHHILATPYRLFDDPSLLIIGLGGGADALAAIANGVTRMTAIELNPVTVRLGKREFAAFNGGLFDRAGIEVVTAEARHWVESTPAAYDLIVLNSIDTLSALSSGAYVLAESYLYTVEAFTAYLSHLKPGGIYALFSFDNNGLAGPTFIIQRFVSTLVAALGRLGAEDPKRQLVVLASAGTVPLVSVLVKRTPFEAAELGAIGDFAAREGFGFWHRPDRPVDHQVASFLWMSDAERRQFLDRHYLQLTPATDRSPFFFNFYKWRSVLRRDPNDTGLTPSTGQRMLLVMLIEAVVLTVIVIFGPLARLHARAPVRKPWGFVAYFAALGIGFIFIEISLLQRFVLFLGFPTYSLSVVLFSLLTFTGVGSALSSRLERRLRTVALLTCALVTALVLLFLAGAPALFRATLRHGLAVRIALSVLTIAPFGMLLGLLFPIGVRLAQEADTRLVPWAWGLNGCTTVIGTIVAVMLAVTYGFDVVMLAGALIDLAGATALLATARGMKLGA